MDAILSGVGGQGTVLASRLIAHAGMQRGLAVRTAETIGMAQRGGCVTSHVRVGRDADDQIASPLVPLGAADVICAFEPGEATRVLGYLAEDGVMVVATRPVMPVTASLGAVEYDPQAHIMYLRERLGDRVVFIDPDKIAERLGSLKPLNVALLGAACASGALGVSLDEMRAAIAALVKLRFVDMNYEALQLGAEA